MNIMKSKYIVLAITLLLTLSSSATFIPVALAVTTAPTISPSNGALVSGQALAITVSWSGGASVVTIYQSPSNFCSDLNPMAVMAGGSPNPNPSAAVASGAVFWVAGITSGTYICATTLNGGVTVISGVSLFTAVASPVTATVSPSAPTIDLGQAVTITTSASLGVAPYTYQWSTGLVCGAPILGATAASHSFSPPLGVNTYSVKVTDSSVGLAPPFNFICVPVTITVDPALVAGPITPASPNIDAGQTVTLTANPSGGTPSYSYQWYTGAACTSPISGATSSTYAAKPAASTTYYYKVTDASFIPASACSAGDTVTVFPSLSVPVLTLTPQTVEFGDAGFITPTVTWSGGLSTFTVKLYSGSSSSCASDTVLLVTDAGVVGSPHTMSALQPFPLSNTYYCATVTDSAVPSFTQASAAVLFSYVAPLTATLTLSKPSIDFGQSVTEVATLSIPGGVTPFTVYFYASATPACGGALTLMAVAPGFNPLTGYTSASATFTFDSTAALAIGAHDYCAVVTDSDSNGPVTVNAFADLTVNAAPVIGSLVLAPTGGIDQGQTTPMTATVGGIVGGVGPYTVALFSGTGACTVDTSAVGSPMTKQTGPTVVFSFASPGTTTNFCAVLTDSVGGTFTFGPATFTVFPDLVVTLTSGSALPLVAGSSDILTVLPTLGTGSYVQQWYNGAGCVTPISGQTGLTYTTGVLTTTSAYSVLVTDSSIGTPASLSSVCKSITITVDSGPRAVATNPVTGMVYVVDPATNHVSVIDSYSNNLVTTIPVAATPWGLAVDTVNNLIYVTSTAGNYYVIDGATNAVVGGPYAVGTTPEGIALNPTLAEVFIANFGSNTVSVYSMTANGIGEALIATVPVGAGPQSVDIGPLATFPTPSWTVFVTDYSSNTVSAIAVTPGCVPFPTCTYQVTTVAVGSNPWGVAVNQLTDRVYVTNSGSGTVSVLNGSTYATIATLNVGGTPYGIAVDSANGLAYVANFATNTVAAINLATNTLKTSASPAIPIPVGTNPYGVAVLVQPVPLPLTYPNQVYVTNSGSNTVSAINAVTNQVIATIVVT